MKIVTLIARLLLGLAFTVFGINGFHPFMPQPPMTGWQLDFFTVIFVSHYAMVIFACQLVAGVLLLINRFVPVALCILGPVIVNILSFHIFIAQGQGIAPGLVVTVLWFIVFFAVRPAFAGILKGPGKA